MAKATPMKTWLIILGVWTVGYWLLVFVLDFFFGSDLVFWVGAIASYVFGILFTLHTVKGKLYKPKARA